MQRRTLLRVNQPATSPSPDALLVALGLVVRDRRKELHMSQERLAERAHIHRTYIADIERGTRNIALRNVARLATALDLSLVDLFTRIERVSAEPDSP
jgi:transcriptional regulator with XRE-family HTH domain